MGPAVTYWTLPEEVHPGMVLFSFKGTEGTVAFGAHFDGGSSKSGFCKISTINKEIVNSQNFEEKFLQSIKKLLPLRILGRLLDE